MWFFPLVMFLYAIDGDTIKVNIPYVHALIGQSMPIRLADVDTPELRGCEPEKAIQARDFVTNELMFASKVTLMNCKRGSFFRLVCSVDYDGLDLGTQLLERGLAKPYGQKWCDNR